jgi:hypothetical protein
MRNKIYKIFLFILIFSFSYSVFSQNNYLPWKLGEELTYKVKWAFIRLGTLRLHICDTLSISNQKVYHIKCYIDSNPTLFFVNYHTVAETFFTKNFEVHYFSYIEEDEGITYKAEYTLDRLQGLVSIQLTDTTNADNTIGKVIPFSGNVQDGTSLIYYARAHAGETETHTVPYLADESQDVVSIDFQGKGDLVKVGAFQNKLPTYYLEGMVYNKGIAGLSGDFKGWFSADDRRLPLIAKMKVFIGSVSLKLEKYNIDSR